MSVKNKIIFSIIITALMLLSGLSLIDTGLVHNSSGNSAQANPSVTKTYTLTFKETGLENLFPGSMNWTLVLWNYSGYIYYFSGTHGTVNVTPGTYNYQATDYFGQSTPYSSTFTVSSNMTFNVSFTSPQKLVFSGAGLSSQYSWGVILKSFYDNVYTSNSTVKGGSNVVYYGIQSSYSYSWYEVKNGVNTTIGSSSIQIGAGSTDFTFKLPLNVFSNVTVKSGTLPAGTKWFLIPVDSTASTVYSTGSSVNLTLENGPHTYEYGYVLHNGQNIDIANVTLDSGAVSSYTLKFPSLTNVSFKPVSAFPAYTYSWGIMGKLASSGITNTFNISSATILEPYALLPDGAVNVTPYIVQGNLTGPNGGGYGILSSSYNINVSSSTALQQVTIPNYNKVTVKVNGIPSGTYATISGIPGKLFAYSANVLQGQSFSFLAPNGKYAFKLSLPSYYYEGFQFNVTAGGSSQTTSLALYNITFPAPYTYTTFSVDVFGYEPYDIVSSGTSTPGQPFFVYLPNGTYSYYDVVQSAGPSGLFVPDSGTFKVAGSSATVKQNFPSKFYNVTVKANNLPSSAKWSAFLSSSTSNIEGVTNTTSGAASWVWLPAGQYYLSVQSAQNSTQYFMSNYSLVTVSSSGSNIFDLNLTPNSYITFSESGLPSGASWSVTFNGKTYTSSASNIVTSVDMGFLTGSYPFEIGSINGYSSNPGSGYVNLSANYYQSNFEVPVIFTPNGLPGQLVSMNTYTLSDQKLQAGSYFSTNQKVSGNAIAFDSERGNVYIGETNHGVAGIAVLNSSTYALKDNITLQQGGKILSMVVDQSTGYLYASYSYKYYYHIVSVNLDTFSVTLTTGNFDSPVSLLVDPANGVLYAAGQRNIYALNPSSLAVESAIPVQNDLYNNYYSAYNPEPLWLEYSKATGMIYATGYTFNSILEINPATNAIVGNYSFGPVPNSFEYIGGSLIDSANGNIYLEVTNTGTSYSLSSHLEVFNPSTGKFLAPLSIPNGTNFMLAQNPANGNLIVPIDRYLVLGFAFSDLAVGTLAEVNVTTGSVYNSFQTGPDTYQAAVNPKNGDVLVSNMGSDAINVISAASAYGYLNGTVSNKGATVTVDGLSVPLINGAFNVSLAPGTYFVTVNANGSTPVFKEVTIKAYSTTTVDIQMAQSTTYKVYGYVTPGTAAVTLNGISAAVSKTGYFTVYASSGTYTLSAYLNGYFPFSENIKVASNEEVNISLAREPVPTSVLASTNVTSDGFNVTVSNLTETSKNISLDFTSTGNGTITIAVPYSDLKNLNLSEILHSRVYIGGTQYSNFTITVSSNFTVILTVKGLAGDPHLVWSFSSAPVIVPPPLKAPGNSMLIYAGIAAGIIIVIAGVGYWFTRRKKQ